MTSRSKPPPRIARPPYVWQPGQGVDDRARARMRAWFRRPAFPMGEAWFMGEQRRLFPELFGDLSKLTTWDLQRPLEEIASGTASFGESDEWTGWYYYLLAQLIDRSNEEYVDSLLELLVTCFMAIHPRGIERAPYPEFAQDALGTLGRSLMVQECWHGDDIAVGRVLHRSNNNPNRIWCWWDASGDFSAAMFFCLKYLNADQIGVWFASVLAIRAPQWRAQVLVWLVGAHDVLHGRVGWPSDFHDGTGPSIGWGWSHCLRPELPLGTTAIDGKDPGFISADARANVLEAARHYFDEATFLLWTTSFSGVPDLAEELGTIPGAFHRLYVAGR